MSRIGKDIAFPESVVSMLKGDLGQPPGGCEALQKEGAQGEEPMTPVRARFSKTRISSRAHEGASRRSSPGSDEFRVLLLPHVSKVFTDYAVACETYGPVSVLRRRLFLRYGRRVRTLRRHRKGPDARHPHQAQGEIDEKGMVKTVLRIEPAAAVIKGADRNRAPRPPSAAGGKPATPPSRRADAGRDLDRRGGLRPNRQGRRRAALPSRR